MEKIDIHTHTPFKGPAWETYLKEKGFEVTYEEAGQACSLDHKGC